VSEGRLRASLGVDALLRQGVDRLGKIAIEIGDDGLGALQVLEQLADRVIVGLCCRVARVSV
jgi:hypothetical protein